MNIFTKKIVSKFIKISNNHQKKINILAFLYSIIIALLLFIGGCTLSYFISILQYNAYINRQRDHVALKINYLRNNLNRELYANINLTQGLAALVSIQGDIKEYQFLALARELKSHSKLIRNIALVPDNIIRYIYPITGNEKAIGLDYSKTPAQYDAIQRAIIEKKQSLPDL